MNKRTISLLVALLGVLVVAFYLRGGRNVDIRESGLAKEYRLYKTEARKDASLEWKNLGTVHNPESLKALFPDFKLYCQRDWTGIPGAENACAVYVRSLNSVPVMYLNFIFSSDRLLRASAAVPQEAHLAGVAYLRETFGQPNAAQNRKISGVRLYGWKLADGSTIFYNIDKAKNDFEPSSIQWMPKDGCNGLPCIR